MALWKEKYFLPLCLLTFHLYHWYSENLYQLKFWLVFLFLSSLECSFCTILLKSMDNQKLQYNIIQNWCKAFCWITYLRAIFLTPAGSFGLFETKDAKDTPVTSDEWNSLEVNRCIKQRQFDIGNIKQPSTWHYFLSKIYSI